MRFEPVDRNPDLAALEERVLQRWRDDQVFQRTLDKTAGGPVFTFYDGPPTANGRPGVHHVEARVFKDIFPRYLTMKGYHVPRKAGWDCHGIPVELEVEKQLGISRKSQIEQYGVAKFNQRCRESVTRYVAEFDRLTERIGYWVDTQDAYWTMSTEYVESVWWSLKTLYERDFLYEGDRVAPYCPRCGTTLSDHELAQGYRQTDDPSIYVRFPVLTGPLADEHADLLIWTTMPWTLVPATLAVVSDELRYVLATGDDTATRPVVMAADRLHAVLGESAQVLRDVAPAELIGAHYRAPFNFVGPGSADDPDGDPSSWRYVVVGDFVKADEGTGIVHTGAAFGHDDMRIAREHGAPVVKPVDLDGRFDERVVPYAGMYVRDTDDLIAQDLRTAGLLLRSGTHRHTYPFCWRCQTPLLYYAKPSWYIATSRLREQFLVDNTDVDWRPSHIRDGRYGDWLAGNVDWALSRERYWGTPLPLWRCDRCAHTLAVGSLAELGGLAGADLTDLDPHRPHIDEITFACDKCKQGMVRRVPEVTDAWYDSGAMPFAQYGHPHTTEGTNRFNHNFPADLVCEAIDQTRGWFYSLQAVGTLLFGHTAYRRALCLGHILGPDGRKMSKSAGNVMDPWSLVESHGADPLRWFLLVDGNPWQSRRIAEESLQEVTRKVFHTLWNTYYFLVTYANLADWTPQLQAPPLSNRPVLDRWILARLTEVTTLTDAALADFDATRAGRILATFIDDLSNWYLRCSRSRFTMTGGDNDQQDTRAAFATLHTCLAALSGLLAPIAPFIADELHLNLVRRHIPEAPESVHLTSYPQPDENARDADLCQAMTIARRLVSLGRDARNAAEVPVRRPLRRVILTSPTDTRAFLPLVSEVIAAELNVKAIEFTDRDRDRDLIRISLKPNYRALGPDFGTRTKAVAAAIATIEPEKAVAELRDKGHFTVDASGDTATIRTEHVQILEEPRSGWQVSSEGPYSAALDLEADHQLHLEGLARQFTRLLNEQRKHQGIDLGERVAVTVSIIEDPSDEFTKMLNTHRSMVALGVAADSISLKEASESDLTKQVKIGHSHLLVEIHTTTPSLGI